jgi:hypothetical protein
VRRIRRGWFEQPQVGGGKWKRIRQLSRFDEVVSRLKEGQSPDYIARLVQEEMKECTDLSQSALSNLLRQYRAQVLGVVAVEDGGPGPDALDRALKEKVDLYEQYAFLVNAQTWRVKRALTREAKQGGGMLANLYRDLDVLRQTLKDFSDFQLETGMIRRQPVTIDASLKSETLSMSMLLTADAATRDEARAATQELVKLLGQPAAEAEIGSPDEEETLDDEA